MKSSGRMLLIAGLLVAVSATIPRGAWTQTVPQLGTPPFSSVTGGPDSINLSNLSIHYTVPVFSRPGHGLPFSFNLNFDNVVMSQGLNGSNQLQWMPFFPFTGGGFGAAGAVFWSKTTGTCTDGTGTKESYNEWIFNSFLDASGTTHPIYVKVTDNIYTDGTCKYVPGSSGVGGATDGSGISVGATDAPSASVTFPNGTVAKPPLVTATNGNWTVSAGPYTVTDSNGNQITAAAPGGVLASITDTLDTIALSVSGTWPNPIKYTYTAPSGAAVNVTRSFVSHTVQTAFGCPGIAEYPATSFQLLDRITLPDGSYYSFTYEKTSSSSSNVTGRIASVHLPTGGTISYTYTGGFNNTGIFCADGSVAGMNRQTPDGTWKYLRTLTLDSNGQPSTSTNTVTDPLGNQTVVDFGGNYETQRQIYTGTAGGTPLETLITCYNGNTTNCAAATASRITTPTEVTVYRSLNGGPQSEVDTLYSGPLVTKKVEYDFGVTTPARTTTISYASLGNGIIDRPSQITVQDGSGNPISQTKYTYDEDAGSLQPSGASSLVSVTCNTSPCRGNVTTVENYVTSSTFLTKKFTHYDTGQVYQATDVNAAVSTNTYGACNHSLLSQTAMPLGLSTSYQWNCTGGVVIQVTDPNSQNTYTNYTTDKYFWRPESAKDQMLNVTSFTYTGLTQTESVLPVLAGVANADVVKTLDTLGRPSLTQTRQAPGSSSFDTVQQSYDSDGRSFHITMPCVSTLGVGCSGTPQTSTYYDGMGRQTSFADGSTTTVKTTSYTENDVYGDVVAPAGEKDKRKQLQYDGLGRLTSVCEVTAGTSTYPGAACNQSSSQTGYLTTYAYSTNSSGYSSLTVTQSAQGGTSQTRTYVYDMLGRLTSETNPESGTTQYFWDAAPAACGFGGWSTTGDLGAKMDNAGVYTCNGYDALHRLQGFGHVPSSSCSGFGYDSATPPPGVTVANTAGRLVNVYTNNDCKGRTNVVTDEWFSYDARGEITRSPTFTN